MNKRPRLDRTKGVEEARRASRELGCNFVMLGHGKFSLIDFDDEAIAAQRSWCCDKNGYAVGSINGKSVFLHRFLLDLPVGVETDHANHNTLDNRRCNLRPATRSQNFGNKLKTRIGATSRFKGVSRVKKTGKWQAQSRTSEKTIYLGKFSTEIEAAQAYNNYAMKRWGEFALLNQL